MRDTLEDLYYGNIIPCDKRIRAGTPLKQALEEAEGLSEQLEARLDREGKALFQRGCAGLYRGAGTGRGRAVRGTTGRSTG